MASGTLKTATLSALASLVLSVMIYVPVWFVTAVISRLATGHVHRATFFLAGVAALAFYVWVFRVTFSLFRQRVQRTPMA